VALSLAVFKSRCVVGGGGDKDDLRPAPPQLRHILSESIAGQRLQKTVQFSGLCASSRRHTPTTQNNNNTQTSSSSSIKRRIPWPQKQQSKFKTSPTLLHYATLEFVKQVKNTATFRPAGVVFKAAAKNNNRKKKGKEERKRLNILPNLLPLLRFTRRQMVLERMHCNKDVNVKIYIDVLQCL